MRRAFFQTLTKLAERDPRIVLLTADLGYLALECFAERHPDIDSLLIQKAMRVVSHVRSRPY